MRKYHGNNRKIKHKGLFHFVQEVTLEDFYESNGILLRTEIEKQMELGNIVIEGSPNPNGVTINPNSINLTLNNKLKVYDLEPVKEKYDNIIDKLYKKKKKKYADPNTYLDMNKENRTRDLIIPEDGLILYPGILYIGSTNERTLVKGLHPTISGRSSTGRLGLSVHITAGFGDNGFDGTWTLEITVEHPLKIYPNKEICQVSFNTVVGDPENPKNIYNGRYQHQEGPTASRMHL